MDVEHQFLVSLIGDLGALGFILWITHRLTTHTIPRLAKQFEEATEKQRQDFREALKEQRVMFEARARREEEIFTHSLDRLALAIENNTAQCRPVTKPNAVADEGGPGG
jgi:hypothetical protein